MNDSCVFLSRSDDGRVSRMKQPRFLPQLTEKFKVSHGQDVNLVQY